MTLVYRMEAPVTVGGQERMYGPWIAGIYDEKYKAVCNTYRNEFRGYPKEPDEDNPSKKFCNHGHVVGCLDFYQMSVWLPWRKNWEDMVELGFRISVYEVPDEHLGRCNTQVFWHPDHATLLSTISYDEMREIV